MTQNLAQNAPKYIIFSVFFSARAYYPVLAILFLDLGLTLDQFVLLNLIWAATIFLFEVPSGALADTFGRKRLLIAASFLMIAEMLCLLFAPLQGGGLLFAICVINRICSGLSEACASGADEALAYDSLPEQGRENAWDQLLARAMRWRSVGFVVAMIIGGVLYDPAVVNHLLPTGMTLSTEWVHRLPVALVLCQAVVCLLVCLSMQEPPRNLPKSTLIESAKLTLTTARWFFSNPRILVAVLIGLLVDSIIRNFATINSSYYRLIELPEWSYGFIGAAFGISAWFIPSMAKYLNKRMSMLANLGLIVLVTLIGLITLVPAWAYWGLVPAMLLMNVIGLLGFTLSRVLHNEADSAMRATALSVKGLMFNLGYGLFSLAFSWLLGSFSHLPEGAALRSALLWQVPVFALFAMGLLAWARMYLGRLKPRI